MFSVFFSFQMVVRFGRDKTPGLLGWVSPINTVTASAYTERIPDRIFPAYPYKHFFKNDSYPAERLEEKLLQNPKATVGKKDISIYYFLWSSCIY